MINNKDNWFLLLKSLTLEHTIEIIYTTQGGERERSRNWKLTILKLKAPRLS